MNKTLHRTIQRVHFAHGQSYDRHGEMVFGGMYRRVAEEVAASAPIGGLVLDAGCGTGRLVMEIARRRPDLQVRGVDLEPGMVEVATRRAEAAHVADQVEFTVADLAALPLFGRSVDLIVSTLSMHHWTDVGPVIASLGRVLQPAGQIWIYDMRLVPTKKAQAAANELGRTAMRTTVRTGWFPAALLERLVIGPAS